MLKVIPCFGSPGLFDESHLRVVFVCPDRWSGLPFRDYEERYTWSGSVFYR